jgi:hypothetical protein
MNPTRRKPPRPAGKVSVGTELVGVARDMARTLAATPVAARQAPSEPIRHVDVARYFRRLSQLVDRLTAASRTGGLSQRDVAALSTHLRKYRGAAPLRAGDLTSRWLQRLASELTAARGFGEPVRRLEHAAQLFATIADLVDASAHDRKIRVRRLK